MAFNPKPVNFPPRPFEAFTQCPRCEYMGYHFLRPMLRVVHHGPIRRLDNGDGTTTDIIAFGGAWDSYHEVDPAVEKPSAIERQCQVCHFRWDQLP